ncbi:MAG TPA: patatin-like phospholipase family protein [Terriglobales bacterium]|nr:patatin-like phospholipase family protein [Terriglobales bacterium]
MSKLSQVVRSVRAFGREFARLRSSSAAPAPKRPAVGLALGGGFARGLAHIGVLKVLEEHRIPIDCIAGTSVGSLIGAAYCSGISAKELEEIAYLVRFRDFARWTVSRFGFASNDRMARFLEKFLKVRTFEELRIPLAVSATDFSTGEAVVLKSGSLVDAVRASCAYPGMFLPVNVDGRLLIDGMLAHPVPTAPVRELGAERVVAVYLSAHWVNLKGPRHIFDVIGQCFSIAQQRMCEIWQSQADLILQPDVQGFSYDGFDKASDLIAAGEKSANEALPMLKRWTNEDSTPAEARLLVAPNASAKRVGPPTAPVQSPAS